MTTDEEGWVLHFPPQTPGSLFTGQKPPKHADRRRNEIPFRYGEPVSW